MPGKAEADSFSFAIVRPRIIRTKTSCKLKPIRSAVKEIEWPIIDTLLYNTSCACFLHGGQVLSASLCLLAQSSSTAGDLLASLSRLALATSVGTVRSFFS